MPTSSADPGPPAGEGTRHAHLVMSGVSAGYGPAIVIDDISLEVGRGEVVAVVGPNGAGKSTLLKAVIGVLRPMSGRVTLAGREISGLRTDRIARLGMGYVPQVRDVFEPLTVTENLEMGGYALPRAQIPGRIAEVLDLYPALSPLRNRHAGNLSGGERKMLALARALMTRPSLLVLDEPSAGLSPQLAEQVLHQHVGRLATTGVAVLLVEQRARDALQVADRAVVLASGRVVMADAAATLLERPDFGEILLGRSIHPNP